MIRKLLMTVPALMIMTVPALASAHVVVTPNQATVGDYQTFSVSVPNEKEVSVTSIKLDIPAGVAEVTPTVKPGWTIQTATNGAAKDPEVTSITWSEGAIPAGQRDDFTFSAQVPAKATSIDWKAYQTYEDGTIVHWDQKPAGSDDADGDAGPYSVTKVVNDLTTTTTSIKDSNGSSNTTLPLVLSLVAILLSLGSLLFKKK